MKNKIAVIALISLAPVYGAHNNNASCSSDNGLNTSNLLSLNNFSSFNSSNSVDQPTYVQIESAEGHVFTIDERVALQSGTIAGMLAPEVRKMMCNSGEPIQFNELSSASLSVLFRLMQYAHSAQSNASKSEENENYKSGVDLTVDAINYLENILQESKYKKYLQEDLIIARNFLDIEGPAGTAVAVVAHQKGVLGNKAWPKLLKDNAIKLSNELCARYCMEKDEVFDEKTHFLSIRDLIVHKKMPVIEHYCLSLIGRKLTSLEGLAGVEGCNRLLELKLGYNKIVEIKESAFAGLNCLRTLELNHNKIMKIEKNAFAGLKDLAALLLHGNQIAEIKKKVDLGLPLQVCIAWVVNYFPHNDHMTEAVDSAWCPVSPKVLSAVCVVGLAIMVATISNL